MVWSLIKHRDSFTFYLYLILSLPREDRGPTRQPIETTLIMPDSVFVPMITLVSHLPTLALLVVATSHR